MELQIDLTKMLADRNKSLFALAQETGLKYETLWRIQKGDRKAIHLSTLSRICEALECTPNDVIVPVAEKPKRR
jgi:putative transcriptional regulator